MTDSNEQLPRRQRGGWHAGRLLAGTLALAGVAVALVSLWRGLGEPAGRGAGERAPGWTTPSPQTDEKLKEASAFLVEASVLSLQHPEEFDRFIGERRPRLGNSLERCLDTLIRRYDWEAMEYSLACTQHRDAAIEGRCAARGRAQGLLVWLRAVREAVRGKSWTTTEMGRGLVEVKKQAQAQDRSWREPPPPAVLDRTRATLDCSR